MSDEFTSAASVETTVTMEQQHCTSTVFTVPRSPAMLQRGGVRGRGGGGGGW